MNQFNFSKRWGLAVMALPLAAWAAGEGSVTFNARVEAGERIVVSGSVVTLGEGTVLAPGAVLVVRASEGVVFVPGINLEAGTLDMHVGSAPLAKPTALISPVEAFAASVRRTPDGFVLRYVLPAAGRLNLRVLDAQGKTVFKTSLRARAGGNQEKTLIFSPKQRGVYLVRAEFAGDVVVQRVFFGEH